MVPPSYDRHRADMIDVNTFVYKVDRFVNFLKWPAATGSALLLIPLARTFFDCAVPFWQHKWLGFSFLVGIALLFVPLLLRGRLSISHFWATFEHEMTHIIFALLTFHSVHSLHATEGDGGEFRHSGGGNWLITVSPYFFPTVPLLVSLFVLALPAALFLVGVGAVGFSIAWHLVATIMETHRGQTDLHTVGLAHAAMFLPGASVFCLGFVLALANRGGEGPGWYWSRLVRNVVSEAQSLIS